MHKREPRKNAVVHHTLSMVVMFVGPMLSEEGMVVSCTAARPDDFDAGTFWLGSVGFGGLGVFNEEEV